MRGGAPAGYVRVAAGRRTVVTQREHEADARAMLASAPTLHDAAAHDAAARAMAGRGVAYAIRLPTSGTPAVVRHNRHGGLLAPLTRDLFFPPTRAPYELDVALRLASAGVRTPPVLMIGIERVAGVLRRSDVVTREIERGRDLGAMLLPDASPDERAAAWRATEVLVRTLDAAGARHYDLNVKNVLIARAATGFEAWVLDVDRIAFSAPDSMHVRAGNRARLLRSVRKWQHERGAIVRDADIAWLAERPR